MIAYAKNYGLTVEVCAQEAETLFGEARSSRDPILNARYRVMLSGTISTAIDCGVDLERLLAVVKALWDRAVRR